MMMLHCSKIRCKSKEQGARAVRRGPPASSTGAGIAGERMTRSVMLGCGTKAALRGPVP